MLIEKDEHMFVFTNVTFSKKNHKHVKITCKDHHQSRLHGQ